jgi:hypothetical protein
MAQDSYDEAMAAHAIVLELDESAIKSQIIKDGYIYFPDGNLMYKISPYKAVGNADKLVTLGVQKWYSVNVATGEDLDDAGLSEVDVDNKGNYFVVNSNDNKLTTPALISSEPNKIYL